MKKEKKGVDKHISINIFYDSAFWFGMLFLIVSYIIKNINVFIIGLVLLLLSLLIFELEHKKEKKTKYAYLFYILIALLILLLLYLLRNYLVKIITYPFSSSLLYLLYGLTILVFIVTIFEWIKKPKKKKIKLKKIKPELTPVIKKISVRAKKAVKPMIKPKRAPPKFLKTLSLVFFVLIALSVLYLLLPYIYHLKWLIYAIIAIIAITFILLLIYLYLHKKSKTKLKTIAKKTEKPVAEEGAPAPTKGGFETDFDKLYNLVQKKGKVKISVIAKTFGIKRKKAEEWAGILEGHGLLKVHYPPIGEPQLIKIVDKKAEQK